MEFAVAVIEPGCVSSMNESFCSRKWQLGCEGSVVEMQEGCFVIGFDDSKCVKVMRINMWRGGDGDILWRFNFNWRNGQVLDDHDI